MIKIKLTKTEIKLIELLYNSNIESIELSDFNKIDAAKSLSDRFSFYFSCDSIGYSSKVGRFKYLFTIKHLGFMPDFIKGLNWSRITKIEVLR